MATYNSAKFLEEQLASFKNQDYQNFKVYASDDGSTDSTLNILEKYKNIDIRKGPSNGFARNFYSMICAKDIEADYIAFSDHDDIWEPYKLSRSISFLKKVDENIPALYCSRTELIDTNNHSTGFTVPYKKKPCFQNALVQYIATGNTMVLNRAARNLLAQTNDPEIKSHDRWAYMLVSGAGGKIIYDPMPTVRYRQHESNVSGTSVGIVTNFFRSMKLLKGEFKKRNQVHCKLLLRYRELLTPENQDILDDFCSIRTQSLLNRIINTRRSGIYCQTLIENIGLFASVLLKRI